MANTAESGFSPVRQFDPYTRPRPARWPIAGRLSQCLLQPVHVWLTAKLTITGQVDDASGKPVAQATVLVYEAGVRKGYSLYCPTCWTDCGKRATTDAEGK